MEWLFTGKLRENEYIPDGVASVVRRYNTEISKSVLRDWYTIARMEGVTFSSRAYGGRTIKENKTERTFEYNGRIVEFFGCDDFSKVKGPRRKILYVTEADTLPYEVFRQMAMRTECLVLIDFNPDDEEVWIKKKIEEERANIQKDVDLVVSTFRDNAFLPRSIVDELLLLAKTDPDLWRVYGNGEYGKIKGAIFKQGVHWDIIADVPSTAESKGYGMDFGYTNDPTVLVKAYEFGDAIVLDEIFRETGLVNTYKDERKKMSSIQGHFELYDVDDYDEIWADSSEPKSVDEIYNAGYNIHGVVKGPGSVVNGLQFMKKYKIYITARSLELIKEFKKYKWKVDKEGKTVKDKEGRPVPIDKYNHGIDASNYVIRSVFFEADGEEEYDLVVG